MPNINTNFLSNINFSKQKNATASFETLYITDDGKEILLNFTVSPFFDISGKSIGYIIIFQDVTNIKIMEKAVERSERLASIGRIAAGLAHEIRNPLGSISGSIQMLSKNEIENGIEDSKQKLMSIILRETERLNHIIDNFLSASSPNTKQKKNINLHEIVNEAVELFQNDMAYRERIKVSTDIDRSITLNGNPESLKQVFWNLLLNSAQAIEKEGNINISTLKNDEQGNKTVLVFSDTGCGIEESNMTKIFEPFYSTKNKGTGLGLSSALKILEDHNATINIKSLKGEGTTFQIAFPIGI